MVYLFTGTDHARVYHTLSRYLAIMREKQPGATVLVFTADNFDQTTFEEALFGQSLFLNKHIVAARRLSENELAGKFVLENIEAIAKSPSAFLFYEPRDFAQGKPARENELAQALTKVAKDVKVFNQPVAVKPDFNIFTLTNDLGARDREHLWLDYHRAIRAKVEPLDVFWKLLWQVKSMIIASRAKDITKTELKPAVAARAARASRNFKPEELTAMLTELTTMYHETFLKSDDFNFRLEKFILSV